jgi:type I restriction enzyme S subunit
VSEELPPGWALARLGDLVEPIEVTDPTRKPDAVFRYIDIGSIDNEALRIAEPKTFSGKEAPSRARRVVREGDVLFSTVRPYLRNIALAGAAHSGCLTSTGISVLRAKPSVLPGYLFRLVSSPAFVEEVGRSMDGTLYPAVRDSDVLGASIPLPPLAEQRRIVARIEALFARIRQARADLLRIAPLSARYRRQALARAVDDAATAFPTTTLGSLVAAIEAGKNIRCEERRPRAGERGIVKISAVTWGEFDAKEIKTAPTDAQLDPRSRIADGDFLLSRANTLELVGAPVVAKGVPPDTYLSDKVLRLRFHERVEHWVYWYLRSPQGRAEIESRSSGNQLSMRNISQAALRSIPLPLPPPTERNALTCTITAAQLGANAAEQHATRALALLDHLERSILARAFRGDLVPQDPADEPAAVTLARLAEAAAPSAPRRRRASAA